MKLTDEQIRDELRALRPTPTEEFSAELDAWAAAGFPPRIATESRESSARRPVGLRLRQLLAPAAGAATILVAVVVAVGVLGDGGPDPGQESLSGDDSAEVAPGGAEPPSDSARDSGPGVAAEPAPSTLPPLPQGERLRPGQERVQERSASITLSTEPDEVDDVADGVVDVVDRYEGIVVSSHVSSSAGTGRADFDLRIPTANLQAALADLSDLASVASRNEGTLDITSPLISAGERFEDAKAEVDALLDELAEADSATEIASIREQLRLARAELAASRAELGALKQRADFSRLTVAVVGDGDADGWSLGDAVDDAFTVLEDLAGAGLVALAVIVPLGALAALVWVGAAWLRRRRRESALDD